MAGKPRDRRELRRQYDAAEPLDPMEDEAEDVAEDADEDSETRKPKKKPKAAPKAKTKTPKAAKPAARMRIVWVVTNDAFKPIATFEYNQREAADAKAKEMTERGKGVHFVQKSKEAMPDDAPGIGAVLPRPIVDEKAVAVKEAVAAEDDEEPEAEPEPDDDDEIESEPDDEEDED